MVIIAAIIRMYAVKQFINNLDVYNYLDGPVWCKLVISILTQPPIIV